MDQKYLQDLYALITSKDPSYSTDFSYEKFVQKMQDQTYANKMFGWLSSSDPGFAKSFGTDFFNKIKVGQPQPQPKQEQPIQEQPDQLKKKAGQIGTTDLSLGTSSLGLQLGSQNTTADENKRRLSFAKPSLDIINEDLINSNEEYVVPQMKYHFGDMGFKFEESGLTGDWMTVTAPNGQKKEFGLDPFMGIGADNKAKELRKWMEQNIGSVPQGKIDQLILQKEANIKKYSSEKEVEEDNNRFSKEADDFQKELSRITNEKETIQATEQRLKTMTAEQKATPAYAEAVRKFEERKNKFISDQANLKKKYAQLEDQEIKLKQNIGKYTEMKSQQGQWGGGLFNSFLEGFGSMASSAWSNTVDFFNEVMPASWYFSAGSALPIPPEKYQEAFDIASKFGINKPEGRPPAAGSKDKQNVIYPSDIIQWYEKLPQNVKDEISGKIETRPTIQVDAIKRANQLGYEGPKGGQDFMEWYNKLPSNISQQLLDEQQDKSKKAGKYDEKNLEILRNSYKELFGDKTTTAEWADAKQADFWGATFLSVAKSLPAMIGSNTALGWAQRTAQMYAQTTDGVMQEIENDPELSRLSENEKLSVVAPIGVAGAVLETYGLRNMIGGKGLLNGLVARALGKSGVNTTAKTFGRFIKEDIDNMIARGVLTVSAAGLAEFETGAAQEFAELGIKEVYNQIKDKKDQNGNYMKMFNTPESIVDWAADVLRSGAQEAIGGFLLGVPSGVSTAYTKRGFKGMDDMSFLAFEAMANDDKMQSAYIVDLKNKVNRGDITMAQAKESLTNYRNSVGLFRSLPEGLDLESKKEAMNLLREKKEIEQTIQGKDKELTRPQQRRIDEINQQLNKLSEDAIQKPTADESVLRTGEAGMGLQEVGERNQVDQEKANIVSSTEKTKEALDDMTPEQKRRIPLFDKDGNKVQINGFEDEAAGIYQSILAIPEENRTEKQNDFVEAMNNAFTELASTRLFEAQQKLEAPVIGPSEQVAEETVSSKTPLLQTTETVAEPVEKTDEEIVEYSPTEEISDKNGDVLGNVLQSKNISPQAEPMVTDFGDTVVFEYNNFDEGETNTRLTFKKQADGSISSRGVKVERNTGLIRNTPFFRNYVESQRSKMRSEVPATQVSLPQATFDEVANLDTKEQTNLEKVFNFLDNIDQSLDKFGRETAGINLALPVMKAIVKSLKVLVQGGMALQDAIKKVAAENNVSEQDVVQSMIQVLGTEQDQKPEGYDTMMQEVDGIVKRMNQRGEYNPAEILNSVLGYVQGSKAYENATAIQQENLVREMRERFGQRERQSPTAERVTGQQRRKITVDELSALKQQIRLEIKAAKDGAKSVSESIKAILRYFLDIKDRGNLTNKDLLKVLSIVSNVRDQRTLDKAADKIYNIVQNATTDTIEVSESKALREGLRRQALAAREAKKDLNEKRRILGFWIENMASRGQITSRQAVALINKLSKLNLDNQLLFDRFLDYAENVFNDAEYASKLKEANSLRKAISKLSRNKDKSANLKNFGKKFLELKPSMIEDLDTYIDMASKLKESLRGSTIRQGNVSFADIINVENADQYLQDSLDEQNDKMKEEALAELQELLGVDLSQFSYEDIISLLEGNQRITKYDDAKVRDDIKKAFNLYSSIINKILETGKDPFADPNDPTSQDIELSKTQKRVVKNFMSMDLDRITKQEALDAVDALVNFIQNQSTARMDDVYSRYLGSLNISILRSKNIVAKPLRKYFSKGIGKLLASYTTNLGPLFERMFKGVMRGGLVEDMSGLTKVKNGKALAEKMATIISNDFIKRFYSEKTNGEAFNSSNNIVERGMAAFLLRNVIGTKQEREAEFKRRVDILKESISVLRDGNELEQKRADIYQQVFDKIFDLQTESGENVVATGVYLDSDLDTFMLVDQYGNAYQRPISYLNIEAIKYWRDRWSEVFDDLSDVSQNVYNKILERDEFYTTDRYSRLNSVSTPVEIANDQSAFHENNGTIYQKETGVLMSATRPKTLPVNKNGKVERYIDLAFDNNNANSMYDALVDINTAAAIRQVDAFLNSNDFSKLVPEKEDADLLTERIKLYIGAIRNKNPYENDQLKKFSRKLNKIAALGVSQSLAGIFQPFKQVIPMIPNTLINSGRLDLGTVFNPAKMRLINESGYAIANRGYSSQAQLDSINKMIEEAASSNKLTQTLDLITKLNELYLKILLVAPDVAIARASWLSYYEQSLKKQGIDISGIDWDTHELNETAANYAQRMLDRQQNISDPEQAGKLFMKGNEARSLMIKMFMPFASFRLNQATRLANDLSTIGHWGTSSKEDKIIAIRSLSGYAVETVLFKGMSAGITIALGSIAAGVVGDDEEEEDRQKRIDNAIKGQVTSFVTELLSPVPFLDKAVQLGVYNTKNIIDNIEGIAEDKRVNIFEPKVDDTIKSLGLFGITAERAYQLGELLYLGNGGSFTDNYGKKRYIDKNAQEVLLGLAPFSFATSIGLLPSEVNSVIRSSLRIAKRQESSTKEGGKTEEEEELDEKVEGFRSENKEEREKIKQEKINAIRALKLRSLSPQVQSELNKILAETQMTAAEKRAASDNKVSDKMKEKDLLGPYRNRTEMKKNDPARYEMLFGEGSKYRRQNYFRNQAEDLLDEYLENKREIDLRRSRSRQ